MSARAVHLVIDARPRGPRGPLAAELVLGKSVLNLLLDQAVTHGLAGKPVVVHAREEDHPRLRELAGGAGASGMTFVYGPPRADAAVLRTDRVYDSARLKRALRQGRSPESAVIWRLDRPESLGAADEELSRRLTYQPLGKYWAFPLARRLAEYLCPTSIRPNALTLTSGALMLSAAGLIAAGPDDWSSRFAVSLSMALALVLDTADGRLARLQGTSSAFGRWLDQVLDELADLALHAAIAWAAFRRDANAVWLVMGIIFVSGKYLFLVQSLLGNELEAQETPRSGLMESAAGTPDPARSPAVLDRLAALARLIGHADLRWHLWIVLALVGRLDVALASYAAYFPLRALGGAVRKGARYA
jgi:phosphatidylglycerophosphate synthase